MKRVFLILAGLVLAGGVTMSAISAYAQAINHDAIIATLQDMKGDINRMIQLVERHKAATATVGDEQITLTSGQLTQIINKYVTLKAGLAAKYGALP